MNKRLKAILSHIHDGIGVIDVGTDHGYIPAALLTNGYGGNIIASDINEGPLEAARRTAINAGGQDRVEFLLCDGLEQCDANRIDTIVIAGMGGDTICGILDRAEWCMSPGYQLILQPMTKAEVLRFWLINNGFEIIRDEYVLDGNIYQIIVARFGSSVPYSDAELFLGKYELVCRDELFPRYLDSLIKRFEYAGRGMMNSESGRDNSRAAFEKGVLDQMLEIRDRYNRTESF